MFRVKNPITGLFVATAIAMIFLIFVALFLYAKIRYVSGEIRNADMRVSIAEKKKQEFATAERSIDEYQQEIATIDRAFVREDAFVRFIQLLEDIARMTRVSFTAQNARLPLTDAEEVRLSFGLKGDFSGIMRFFSTLDATPYAGIVDQVVIRRVDEKSNVIEASATYLIFNYFKK